MERLRTYLDHRNNVKTRISVRLSNGDTIRFTIDEIIPCNADNEDIAEALLRSKGHPSLPVIQKHADGTKERRYANRDELVAYLCQHV